MTACTITNASSGSNTNVKHHHYDITLDGDSQGIGAEAHKHVYSSSLYIFRTFPSPLITSWQLADCIPISQLQHKRLSGAVDISAWKSGPVWLFDAHGC